MEPIHIILVTTIIVEACIIIGWSFESPISRLFNSGHEPAYPWGETPEVSGHFYTGSMVVYTKLNKIGFTKGQSYKIIESHPDYKRIVIVDDRGERRYRPTYDFMFKPRKKIFNCINRTTF